MLTRSALYRLTDLESGVQGQACYLRKCLCSRSLVRILVGVFWVVRPSQSPGRLSLVVSGYTSGAGNDHETVAMANLGVNVFITKSVGAKIKNLFIFINRKRKFCSIIYKCNKINGYKGDILVKFIKWF